MSDRSRPRIALKSALFLSSAVLLATAGAVRAQDAEPVLEISDDLTDETFATSTAVDGAPGGITLLSGGSITLETPPLGPAITLDSDNTLLVEGTITIVDGDDATGVLINGGLDADFLNTGSIILEAPEDDDTSDDVEPPFTLNRVAVDVAPGGGVVTGGIVNDRIITVNGDRSYGVLLRGDIAVDAMQTSDETLITDSNGALAQTSAGVTRVIGDSSVAYAVFGTPESGVAINGSVDVGGVNSVGVLIDAAQSGAFDVSGTVSATGYEFFAVANEDPDIVGEEQAEENRLQNEEQALRQGGPAIAVRASVDGGFLLNGPNAEDQSDEDNVAREFEIDETTTNDDGTVVDGANGIDDRFEAGETIDTEELETGIVGAVFVSGGAPAIYISQTAYADGYGADGALLGVAQEDIVLGAVGPDAIDDFGAVFRGQVSAAGVFDGISSTAIKLEGADGFTVTVQNGASFEGVVSATAREADATGLHIGNDAIVPRVQLLDTGASISATAIAASTFDEATGDPVIGEATATAILIESGASVAEVENNGRITASGGGSGVNVYAFRDLSGGVTSFRNTGRLEITQSVSFEDVDDDGSISDDEIIDIVGAGVAADFSANTTGVQFRNEFRDDQIVGGSGTGSSARIIGDVLFGSGADTFTQGNGLLVSEIRFGAGDDAFILDPKVGDGGFDPDELVEVISIFDFGTGADSFVMNAGDFTGAIVSDAVGGVSLAFNGGDVLLANLSFLGQLDAYTGNVGVINASDVSVASGVDLRYEVDTSRSVDDGQFVQIAATGDVTIADGALFTPTIVGDLPEFETFDIITSASSLSYEGADPNDLLVEGVTPFIYEITYELLDETGAVGVDDTLRATFRRKTGAELGVETGQEAAYDILIESVQNDDGLRDAIGAVTTQDEFLDAFNQLLPDYSDSVLAYQTAIAEGARRAIAGRASAADRDTQNAWSFWADEFIFYLSADQEADQQGYEGGGFGISIGADKPLGPLDAVGLMFGYASPNYDLRSSDTTRMAFSSYEIGPYAAMRLGPYAFDVAATYGWIDYDTTRTIAIGDVRREAESDGSGNVFSAGARASYERVFGSYYFRPEAFVSYVDLTQDEYQEAGLEDGVGLTVSERSLQSLRGIFETTIGRRRPNRYGYFDMEARLGVRNEFITDAPTTTVTPLGGTESFQLLSEERTDLAARGGLGVSFVSGAFSQVDVTYDAEVTDADIRHEFRLIGRIRF
ncbi:MAG: autotransporter outer membrane beta-barrel domain-containing protein [Pseudomonadota bacterium]